jgi:hypothetical protein
MWLVHFCINLVVVAAYVWTIFRFTHGLENTLEKMVNWQNPPAFSVLELAKSA